MGSGALFYSNKKRYLSSEMRSKEKSHRVMNGDHKISPSPGFKQQMSFWQKPIIWELIFPITVQFLLFIVNCLFYSPSPALQSMSSVYLPLHVLVHFLSHSGTQFFSFLPFTYIHISQFLSFYVCPHVYCSLHAERRKTAGQNVWRVPAKGMNLFIRTADGSGQTSPVWASCVRLLQPSLWQKSVPQGHPSFGKHNVFLQEQVSEKQSSF